MKILFTPYRFGTDILGGAEIYHAQIVRALIAAGHTVDILTTTGGGFEPKTRFGLLWREEKPAGDAIEDIGGGARARVIRCPIKNPSLPALWFACYRLQKQFEQEQMEFDPALHRPVARPLCFTGWQFPEVHGAEVWRWCGARASIILPPGARRVTLGGQTPWRRTLAITDAHGKDIVKIAVSGSFQLSFDIPKNESGAILWLNMPVRWGPQKDVRTLGIFFNQIECKTAVGTTTADLWLGYHHAASRQALAETAPDALDDGWISRLKSLARQRQDKFSALFDLARGPHSPALEAWLAVHAAQYDAILAANFPFATPSAVMRRRAAAPRPPVALLPLMHLDDEFYYWKHYLDYLGRADAVLAISRYAARQFAHWGTKAHFIGVGLEPAALEPTPETDARAFRDEAGLAPAEIYVLMVCRKSSAKNYPMVINAMKQLRKTAAPGSAASAASLVFIGAEEDNVPLDLPFVIRMEGLTAEAMRAAYAGAAAFALMSETESFGMVFLEAWAQGAPVIGSAWCRPVAALIEHGEDGFLARDEASLAAHLATLLTQPDTARAMGRRGRDKVRRDFTQPAFAARLCTALETMKEK